MAQINPRYCAQLQQVLTWPQSTGIVGGRPSSSLYFIGFQDQHVLYLDPHEVQEVRRSFYVRLSDKGGHARSHDNLHIVRHLWQQTVCPKCSCQPETARCLGFSTVAFGAQPQMWA